MAIKPLKAKFCLVCKKLIRQDNRSCLCSHHLQVKKHKEARISARAKKQRERRANEKPKCCICGEECSGKLMIEARRGRLYCFCTFHFNRYELTTLKELRIEIRKAKGLLRGMSKG